MTVTVEQIQSLASRAAWRYKHACWWADVDDLKQFAAEAVIRALRTWDASEGIPFEGYAWRAAILTLSKQVRKASAPVSASDGTLDDLKGIFGAAVDEATGLVAPGAPPDEALTKKQFMHEIRRRVMRLLVGVPDSHLAEPVLLDGEPPRKVAQREGVPIQRVYQAAGAVRKAIYFDQRLWQLWRTKG